MVAVFDVLLELGVFKVDVGDAWRVVEGLGLIAAILKHANRETLELHDVLRQCACLVTENVVHHAQFFVKI